MTGSKAKERAKPKWALTEAEEDAALQEQADELLAFTEQLDFDQWEQQMEAKAEEQRTTDDHPAQQLGLEQVPAEATPASEVGAIASTAADALPPPFRPLTQQQLLQRPATSLRPTTARPSSSPSRADRPSTSSAAEPTASTTPSVAALASSLLHSQPHLRAIHSAHSLRALISREGSKAASVSASGSGCVEDDFVSAVNSCSVAIPEPRIAVIKERTACNAKVDPSHLPYLHRHPAV